MTFNKSYKLDTSCVLNLPLTEGTGTTVYDISGNGNNGSLYNTPIWYKTKRQGNYSLNFNGSNQYISLGDKDFLNSSSICLWLNTSSLSNLQFVYGKINSTASSGNGQTELYINTNGTLTVRLGNNSSAQTVTTTGTISINTWYFICVTYNGTNITITINSTTESFSQTINPADNSNNFCFGRTGDYNGLYFIGKIANVKIFNKVLTTQEIASLYAEEYIN